MIKSEDIKYHGYKFEDFQKSEMFMDFAIEGDFKTEVIATVKNGDLIFLKSETKRIK
ncbi:hypothetical protein SAMN04489761_4282 [Tenacibaculum sp. MAR_2009_124]|uniref:hypothetical protein n=1 Tax=Tenacibaculum sp. MAR_2009_124 TaxID=1250059 RepID=UPI0008955A9C|nr:hypothetical protein [Tenacibaculum sp. MAR_2009_124]SED10292.1 hypothetical protein SAMN04489761_4282 [Tenacibaculum sp. MAR_2009_124]